MKQINALNGINLKLKRIKSQEEQSVFRWFENKNIIASLVEGYFPEECNFRISFCWGDLLKYDLKSIEIRGSKSIILKKTDKEMKEYLERVIKRELTYQIEDLKN